MKHYLITFHESDGNDCTVYDCIVGAETEDQALNTLHDHLMAQFGKAKDWEEDGNMLGFYFPCDCPEDLDFCDGHGGICLRETFEYATEEHARENLASYHVEYTI